MRWGADVRRHDGRRPALIVMPTTAPDGGERTLNRHPRPSTRRPEAAMFIKVTVSGGRRYAQFVESFRNEAGVPRQRTLATLGRLEPDGDVDRLISDLSRAQSSGP